MAANLDLVVQPSQKLDHAVFKPSAPVARPVQPRVGGVTEGVRDESLGRQAARVQVSAREPCTPDIELARNAGCDRLAVQVEDVRLRVGNWPADRHGRSDIAATTGPPGGVHGRLGGAIQVVEVDVEHSEQARWKIRRHCLAAATNPGADFGRPSRADHRASRAGGQAVIRESSRFPSRHALTSGAGRTLRRAAPGPSVRRMPGLGTSALATDRTCNSDC